jgi:hypothetical protein
MDQNEMSKFYRGPSIDASYHVSAEIWWEAPMEGSALSFLKAE